MLDSRIKVLLIVEDRDDYLLIDNLLSQAPHGRFDLDWAGNYDSALESIQAGMHNVCLLDQRLGQRGGLEFLREALLAGCWAPVIWLSGQGDDALEVEAMHMGASDFLEKRKFDAALLERSIRSSISQKRLEERVQDSSRLASIGQLAAGVAHEINNPLASVVGYSQLLMSNDLPEPVVTDLQYLATPAPEPRDPPSSTGHLLVVEDEPLIRNLLATFLKRHSFAVDVAGESQEAWRKVQATSYAAILLDLKMPGMGGPELYQLLETADKRAAEKVIFITGDTANPDTRSFIESTRLPVMAKPFELEELHQQLRVMVG